MTEDIPKKEIKRIKAERKQEYSEGFEAGVEFIKESTYSTIDKIVEAIDSENERKLFEELGDSHDYFDSSSEFKEGFYDALKEALEKSEEDS